MNKPRSSLTTSPKERPSRDELRAELDRIAALVGRTMNPGEAALFVLGWAVGLADKHGVRLSGLTSLPTIVTHLQELSEAWKAGRK
jgi:hypothetical protein